MKSSLFVETFNVFGPHKTSQRVIRQSKILEKKIVVPKAVWTVALINRSDKCFTLMRIKNVNAAQWGKWVVMAKTCRTCSLGDQNACFQAKKWQPIMVTECGGVAFEIEIATTPDAQGLSDVASWNAIQPNCSTAGGVLGYED